MWFFVRQHGGKNADSEEYDLLKIQLTASSATKRGLF